MKFDLRLLSVFISRSIIKYNVIIHFYDDNIK